MSKCSKCEETSTHSILVREEPTNKGKPEKNRSAVKVVRFCETHWAEIQKLLP